METKPYVCGHCDAEVPAPPEGASSVECPSCHKKLVVPDGVESGATLKVAEKQPSKKQEKRKHAAEAWGPASSDVERKPAPPEKKDQLWLYLAGAAVVAAPVGYFLRNDAKAKQATIDDLKKQMLAERVKERREELSMQAEKLTQSTGNEVSAGFTLMSFAVGAAVMVAAMGLGARPRKAAFAFAIPLLVAALYGVYEAGILSMIVSSLLAVGLIYYMTGEPDPKNRREIALFREFPARRQVLLELDDEVPFSSIVQRSHAGGVPKVLREVKELPPPFPLVLPVVGDGTVAACFQLKRKLAYVAFVEHDDNSVSDYVTVLMKLDENGPSFTARPLPIVDGVRVQNTGLVFREDPDFSNQYLIEVPPRHDPQAIRSFLSHVVREELLTFPAVWLAVHGNVMALTLYGPFDAEKVDNLVDVADVLFAEYGADEGPSLLEPDGVESAGAPKRKKAKASGPASSTAATA